MMLGLAVSNYGDITTEEVPEIKWKSKLAIRRSIAQVHCLAFRKLASLFKDDNRSRAIQYARRFLHQRASGKSPHEIPSLYEFADLEGYMNCFPTLGCGLDTEIGHLRLFGDAMPLKRESGSLGTIKII